MASVKKRPDGKWRARYRDPSGKEHARHFDRKVDAERWLAGVETAKARGEWVDPARARITVEDWSQRWTGTLGQLKQTTRARYAGLLRRQVLPRWGRTPLSAVSHADVATWITELSADGLSASSVRQAYRVLSLMLDLAVKDNRIVRNPAKGMRLPPARIPDKLFLDHRQVDALATACGETDGLVIYTLAYTGLRWGELAALRVRRVNLLRRRLEVAESVTEVEGHLVFDTPKSHQCRSVPIPRFLADALAQHLAGKGPDDLVFTARGGGVLRNNNFRRDVFDQAAIDAGLPGLTPHELRHTAASLAVAAGANVKAVQRMLGHASAAMTLDVYAGLFADDLDALADRLDQAAGAARPHGNPTLSSASSPDGLRTPADSARTSHDRKATRARRGPTKKPA